MGDDRLRGVTRAQQSKHLGREMRFNVYGHAGLPLLAFPTSEARYTQWEDFGMIEALRHHIEAGRIQVWTADTIDRETFFPPPGSLLLVGDAIKQYEKYLAYLGDELLPVIVAETGQKPILTGCSMGAYHAGNYAFRHPEQVAGAIALSGVYTLKHFLGSTAVPAVAANSPLVFLQHPLKRAKRRALNNAQLAFCAGQGPNEDEMLADTVALGEVLAERKINGWVDIWGPESAHDWPFWYQQINKFVDALLGSGSQ